MFIRNDCRSNPQHGSWMDLAILQRYILILEFVEPSADACRDLIVRIQIFCKVPDLVLMIACKAFLPSFCRIVALFGAIQAQSSQCFLVLDHKSREANESCSKCQLFRLRSFTFRGSYTCIYVFAERFDDLIYTNTAGLAKLQNATEIRFIEG